MTTTANKSPSISPASWREELRLGCAASLSRLAAIVEERGASYAATVQAVGLR